MKKQFQTIIGSLAIIAGLLIPNTTVSAAQITSAESAVINVENYEVEEGVLIAGEQITIDVTLKNNSKTVAAENVVVTFDSANYALLPVYGEDNQIYVGTIEANSTKNIEVKATVNSAYVADAAQLKMQFTYISGMSALSNSTAIYIPTYASGNLVSESTVVSGNATLGARTLVSVKYKNASTADISDLKLIMSGNIADENKEQSLPVAGAGKTYTEDYYVSFTESGIQTLTIQYRYTDNQGNTYVTDCGEYRINVTNDVAAEGSDAVVENENNSFLLTKFIMLIAVGVGVIVVIFIYLKKRK